jgi:TP901 family phage tail tape measure protein
MSDQVTQQVLVEFLGQVSNTLDKSFKDLIAGLRAIAAQQKETNKAMNEGSTVASKAAKDQAKFATEVEKVTTSKSKFQKVLKSLEADYKKNEAGITSAAHAFGYYSRGVTAGNNSLDIAKRKTTDYLSALMGTNSVLMAADKANGSWAKNVRFNTIMQAAQRGEIDLTKNGIKLLTSEAWKHIGLTEKQAQVLQKSTLAQDLYSKKLREAQLIGGDYLKSFEKLSGTLGNSNSKVAIWSKALDQADSGLNRLRLAASQAGEDVGKVALGVGRASVATNIMNGNLKVSGRSFQIFNEAGLRALGVTEEQAAKLGMLAKSYGLYGTTIQKMTASGDKNLDIFKELTRTYGQNDNAVKAINKTMGQMADVVEKKVLKHQATLNKYVAEGTMTQKEADRVSRNYANSLDRRRIAEEIIAQNQKKMVEASREYTTETSRAASFGREYQETLKKLREEQVYGTAAYKDRALALKDVEKAIEKQAKMMNKAGADGNAWALSQDRYALMNQRVNKQLEIANGLMTNQAHLIPDMSKKTMSLADVMDKLGTSMMNVAKYAVGAFAFYGAVSVIGNTINQIVQYDQSLKDLQAITSATDYQTEMFGETIKEVAGKTKFSAQEVAEGMKNLGQAGFTAAETIEVIDDAATLATGTLSNFETVTDLLTTTIRAFHLEAAEAGRLTDLFANAINRSKLDVDKLRVAFNYFASVAEKANITVDDSVTLMGLLANAGVRASTIGTSLRQVVEGLVSPSKEFTEAIERAGYTTDQFVVSAANPLENVIRRLQKVVPDAAAAFDLFGIRGAPAISAITAHGVQGFVEMKNAMQESGSAAKMAEIQMEGLANKAKNMKDKFELVAVALGDAGLKTMLEVVIDLGRGLADLLAGFLSSSVGSFTVIVLGLAAAIGAASKAVSLFMGLKWVENITLVGMEMVGATAKVNLFTFALGALRTMLTSIAAHPVVWILAIGGAAAAAAVSWYKMNKEAKDYLKIAEKANAQADKDINLSAKKRDAAKSLLAIAKDTTKTDAERSLALERLNRLGVEVVGVVRDQKGVITDLNEAVKATTPNVSKFADEMDRLAEARRADKMIADVEAFLGAEKDFEDAIIRMSNIQSGKEAKSFDSFGGMELDVTGIEEFEKNFPEIEGKFTTANQKVQEILNSWMAVDKASYKAMLLRAGMTQDQAEQESKNFDALDSSYLKFWFKQTENVRKYSESSKKAIAELILMLDKQAEQILNSPETAFKKLQQETQTAIDAVYKSMPDLDNPQRKKDAASILADLDKIDKGLEKIQRTNTANVWKTGLIPNLTTELAAEAVNTAETANDNAKKKFAKDTKQLVDEYGEALDLMAETQKISLDNRIAAIELASANEIGIEQDNSNKILAIKEAQINAEIAAKSAYLAKLREKSPNESQDINATQNQILALQVQKAGLAAQQAANIESKARDERERAETARAYKHNMNLLEIDKTYWNDKNQQEYMAREATIAFLDKEISIQAAYVEQRKAQHKNVYDDEQKLNELRLQRAQEVADKEIQIKLNKEELLKGQAEARATNLETRATNYDDFDAAEEALGIRHALERKEWEDHYKNLAQDKTLYNSIMRELQVKHDEEMDALARKRRSMEYQKNADFFGELSGLMGEFYEISNQKAVGFFYAQKALAIAEIIMNAHAGSAAALSAGPFGIPMSAVILAMGYAKAGMVAGLTVAQGVKGFADGGEITGYSPHSRADNIQINATAGEFMQPVASVDYYGKGAMEAIRTRAIPRDVLSQWAKPGNRAGGTRFADGGEVASNPAETSGKEPQLFNIVNILDPAMFDQYVSSHAGQKAIMNVISKHPAILKGIQR